MNKDSRNIPLYTSAVRDIAEVYGINLTPDKLVPLSAGGHGISISKDRYVCPRNEALEEFVKKAEKTRCVFVADVREVALHVDYGNNYFIMGVGVKE